MGPLHRHGSYHHDEGAVGVRKGTAFLLDYDDVDPGVLECIFNNKIFKNNYPVGEIGAISHTGFTQVDLINDIYDICKKTNDISGLDRLLRTMRNTGKTRFGYRYELDCLRHAIGNPNLEIEGIEVISSLVRTAAGEVTDLDFMIRTTGGDLICCQCKRSYSAFKNRVKAENWINLVQTYARERGLQLKEIWYLAPEAKAFPGWFEKISEKFGEIVTKEIVGFRHHSTIAGE